ncbi:SusC/RagA family TonB-linked outer membrane protein [Marinigracilibium pacificum]|uniref:SusC/RagA family TonB-linked outer membrane protein n=1 Tax=Marinigracilibium pacificum TaxID=2729599 RepID=A0A848J015_9BACT|nr:SusC/RagA family TonB-linked outer membrane protein [Marinigracilibium pacificum]NMM50133.1 SusC/RagA family TonB-linked outer membrane protein [Marinigracilibium pacificum]
MKKLYLMWVMVILTSLTAWAQSTVTGTVKDLSDNSAIPGANVLIKGTTQGNVTDINGKFSISVPSTDVILVVSYVGYESLEVPLNGRTSLEVSLNPSIEQLSEVIVTAYGIEKETKSLGYSVSQLESKQLNLVKETNVVNSLSGRVAGVQVSRTASGPAGSSRVVIRGNNSLVGNNQPLYVVDGVPIDNQNLDAAGRWGGIDYGDGIGDISADDIESVTVLKGPNAAALYGARAANGVIQITTKSGGKKPGVGIDFTSTYTLDQIMISPEYQNEYGAGTGGAAPTSAEEYLALGTNGVGTSWGAPMNGQTITYWDGEQRAYSAQPDNFKDFWETGQTFTNTLAFSGGNETSAFRVSLTRMDNESILPNSKFDRTSITAKGNTYLNDRLNVAAKFTYIRNNAENRANLADIMENPVNGLIWMPRNEELSNLLPYEGEDGLQRLYTSETFRLNPYWAVEKNGNHDSKNRILSYVKLKYELTDWLKAEVVSGMDWYTSKRFRYVSKGTRYRLNGEIQQNLYEVQEFNNMFLLNSSHNLTEGLSLKTVVGGNILRQNVEQFGAYGTNLAVDGFYHLSNAGSVTFTPNTFEKEIWSLFGQASFDYNGYLFLDITGRNDWSSTLPIDNNDFFYPSVSAGFIFSEAFNLYNDFFNYGKVRASWAKVGNDTSPYQLASSFGSMGSHAGASMYGIGPYLDQYVPNQTIPNFSLIPELTKSIEAGIDLVFFKDRLDINFTYYKSNTENQILPTTVSSTTGFGNALINAGEMENSGYEASINGAIIKSGDFSVNLGLRFAKNKNKVISLVDNLDQLLLGADRGISVVASPGNPYGDLMGYDFLRDDNGNVVVGDDGIPLRTEGIVVLGNINPDWIGGLTVGISYKNFRFNSLIDMRKGGDIYSITNRYLHSNGNHENTLEGRAEWYAGTGGYLVDGVTEGGAVNTVAVDPEVYWSSLARDGQPTSIDAPFVYDGTFIKMREMSLTYSFPASFIEGSFLEALDVSLVGRNLFFFKNNVPGVHPESSFNSGNAGGRESASFPAYRSYGVTLNLSF